MSTGFRRLAAGLAAVATIALGFTVALPADAQEMRRGGTLVYGKPKDAVKLDPQNVTDGESFDVTRHIFENLVQFVDEKTEVRPGLAESWSVSNDGKTWTFKLRRGVKFHDGTPFNAQAVVFNFERMAYENNPYHKGPFSYYASFFNGYPGDLEKVYAADEHTVVFQLKKPIAPFLSNLATSSFGIMSPESVKKYGDDIFKNPVGTGPFKFVEWVPNERLVLEKNKDYWDRGKPILDRIIFRTIPENSVRVLELEKGSIHVMHGFDTDQALRIRQNKDLKLYTQTGMNVGYLAMQTEKKPFDDKRVRQAINMAVNKQALVKALYGEFGNAAKNPMPPVLWGYNDAVQDYPYDPDRAKKLLADAGYPNGFKSELWAMPVARPYMPDARKAAEALQADLRKIGVETEIVTMDWGVYLERTKKGDYNGLALLGWTGDNGDPDNFIFTLLGGPSRGGNNIAQYRNPKVDELLLRAQTLTDQKERAKLYEQAQVLIKEDAPWVPLVHSTQLGASRANVVNYKLHPVGAHLLINVGFAK
ncbi:MAG TPA: ABC transporter substrate-binding protein [Thermodesulfobacteriota bacterium]